jgi:tetratricopeptide (TPR) repeat protein
MNLEALKLKARRHEQKEEWPKALDLYRQVIQKQKEDESPDITLYNRIGDIQTRLKHIDAAVESYEIAVDLYLDSELPNNAIAICKKVLRNLPNRSVFFLRMGQIRGAQGFLTDAKKNFLTYAEMMTTAGEMDGALDALVELVDLAPDDIEIRMGLASQLEAHDRATEAAEQYTEAYRHLVLQDRDEEAGGVLVKLGELDPDLVLPDASSIRAAAATEPPGEAGMDGHGPGDFELGSQVRGSGLAQGGAGLPEISYAGGEGSDEPEPAEDKLAGKGPPPREDPAGIQLGEVLSADEDDDDDDLAPLPMLTFEDKEEAAPPPPPGLEAEDAVEFLPTFASGGEGEEEEGEALPPFGTSEEEEAEAIPTLGFHGEEGPTLEEALGAALEDAAAFRGEVAEPEEVPVPEEVLQEWEEAPTSPHAEVAEQGELDRAIEMVQTEIEAHPDEVDLYQRKVEYAFRKGDSAVLVPAYLDLAGCLVRAGSLSKAKAVFQQVLALSPGHEDAVAGLQEMDGIPGAGPPAQVASSEEYVDLGSLILGEEAEKTTRWRVAADTPSGDDQADFAKMLSQFKEKVSEHVDADDVSAHHDLGTAYMEMGLLDEAISEFQMALRASPNHLPTHEVLGRCWLEMGKSDMAVRALNRAMEADFEVEDELIGIYYFMGRAKEELGNSAEATEFYEKVFSLDINFEDVTERLRALR